MQMHNYPKRIYHYIKYILASKPVILNQGAEAHKGAVRRSQGYRQKL
jgi:hypothetical protein